MLIFYLEDNHQDANLVARYLQTTPHEMILAANLEQAHQALARQPDLFIVDLLIGASRDGFKFARELREQGCTQPIIAITALTTPQDLNECQEAGINGVLPKPFTINKLADMIQHYTS
ncbi:MAG TPA: response regulator [Phototrophicaceae bacterium]|nr:response regulator [Phototrophicaceae bacterium]